MKTVSHYLPVGLLLAVMIALSTGCGGESTAADPGATDQDSLFLNPEAVVRQYQAHLDSNRFEAAQQLSTPRSAPLHEMMAAILADTPSDSSLIHTEFLSLNCEVQKDTAICQCRLRDEYEEYDSEYLLIRMSGRWLVDLPEEEGDFEMFEQETLEEWPEQ